MTTITATTTPIRGVAIPLDDDDLPIEADVPPDEDDLVVRVNGVTIIDGDKAVGVWDDGYPFSWAPASALSSADVVTLELILTINAAVRVHREQWTVISISGGALTSEQAGQLAALYASLAAGELAGSNLPRVAGEPLELVPGNDYGPGKLWGPLSFVVPDSVPLGTACRLLVYWPGGSVSTSALVTELDGGKVVQFAWAAADTATIAKVASANYQVGTVTVGDVWTPLDGPVTIKHRHQVGA